MGSSMRTSHEISNRKASINEHANLSAVPHDPLQHEPKMFHFFANIVENKIIKLDD